MKVRVLVMMVVALTFLTACHFSSKVVGEYDTSRLSEDFGNEGAYEIGANIAGMPVFKDTEKALQQAQIDFRKGFEATAEEYSLEPVSHSNYKDYKTYAWNLGTKDEIAKQQGIMITKFMDIYENSFE
ncbi:MAG: hypothetical protein ACI35P_10565 [Bacillus sp. (in: firmicutes)]